jgi:hypothetical protein
MKYYNIFARSTGSNLDDGLMNIRHIVAMNTSSKLVARSTGSMWDDWHMKHSHLVSRTTGRMV